MKSPLDEANLIGIGVVRLGDELTPGEYLLQALVTDGYRKKKQAQVAQWVDFEVTDAAVAEKK
jgi:hypothetical protein